ncbi:MAG: hypothetical protein HKL99_16810 [Burkholderiales bacterium]|nr:hypothetical protein [Burkholderiales bacterium]
MRNLESRLQRLERARVPDEAQAAAANAARQKVVDMVAHIGPGEVLRRLESRGPLSTSAAKLRDTLRRVLGVNDARP